MSPRGEGRGVPGWAATTRERRKLMNNQREPYRAHVHPQMLTAEHWPSAAPGSCVTTSPRPGPQAERHKCSGA
eukprot:1150911-Alexandrium_andersonii.AAC.1